MINLSESAQKAVKRLAQDQGKANPYIRVGVKGGGCSGMTYDVQLDDAEKEGDRVFEAGGVKILCDSKSLIYLDGMTVDFSSDLVGGGFRFVNPNASGTCGCGTSFAV